MKLDASDIADLRPVISAAVADTLAAIEEGRAKLSADRLGYSEREAAAALGVAQYVLRDCRLRGEIQARKVGKSYCYSRAALLAYLGEGSR